MRSVSVSLTEQQVRERRKTVTRRLGCKDLRAGERLMLCRKVMGLRPGERIVGMTPAEAVTVGREPLSVITAEDGAAEGFPDWTLRRSSSSSAARAPAATAIPRSRASSGRYIDAAPVSDRT